VPAVYAALAAPVVAVGRHWPEVLSIYATQAATQHDLGYGMPNLHFFLGRWSGSWTPAIAALATGIAAVAGAAFAWSGRRIPGTPLQAQVVLFAALVSAMLVPHLLPHMHERYFMTAELLAVAVALWQPRWLPLAAAMQAITLVAYAPFLLSPSLRGPVPPALTWLGITDNMQVLTGLLAVASLAHIALLGWLLAHWARHTRAASAPDEDPGAWRPARELP
jgi:hypothetical protein